LAVMVVTAAVLAWRIPAAASQVRVIPCSRRYQVASFGLTVGRRRRRGGYAG
jgi:hypothetical protein